jgi:hypothetical protein
VISRSFQKIGDKWNELEQFGSVGIDDKLVASVDKLVIVVDSGSSISSLSVSPFEGISVESDRR